MIRKSLLLGAALALALPAGGALAQQKSRSALSGFDNSNSKEPYKIDANRLEVQQSANKAMYIGDVVVVQGAMTMRCVSLVIFFNQSKNADGNKSGDAKGETKKASPTDASLNASSGGLKRLECHGQTGKPVTINKEKQTATAQLLVYENETVTMTGSVVMSDGENVQAGEKMVYNTKTTIGRMEGGRVRGIFTPGSDKPKT